MVTLWLAGCVVITGGFAVNVAVIDLLLSSVMVEGLVVPVRSPLHPENCHPGSGTAVSVKKICVNVAVMDLLRSSVMVDGFVVPVRSPLHPENCHPGAGTAVSV